MQKIVFKYTLLGLLISASFLEANSQVSSYASNEAYPVFNNQTIRERLAAMDNAAVKPRYSSGVRGYVNTYAIKRHESTEVMLGKRVMYFPIFEKYLSEQGLPTDLKYLPIVESALKPHAKSRVGAMGLWQFMPATGKSFGLRINSLVDERKDPNRASKAAAEFLQELYDRYGDWALALAAYNAGPGRVNRAIKKARSKNFWKIQRFLPRETRNYVPGFIAAAYICKYHSEHGLDPILPDYDLQVTETLTIYERLTFSKISEVTGVSIKTLQLLNPSYKKQVIPENLNGNYLILPYYSVGAFFRYQHPELMVNNPAPVQHTTTIAPEIPKEEETGVKYETIETSYTVVHGDNIHSIAKLFNCRTENIRTWNKLSSYHVNPGQRLRIIERVPVYKRPKRIISRLTPIERENVIYQIPESKEQIKLTKLSQSLGDNSNDNPKSPYRRRDDEDFVLYSIRRGESIKDISNKFPGVSIDDILSDNKIDTSSKVRPGMVIMVRKF